MLRFSSLINWPVARGLEDVVAPEAEAMGRRSGAAWQLWGDAIYIRQVDRWHSLESDKLLAAAIILKDLYNAADLAEMALRLYDQRNGTQLQQLCAT